MKKVLNEFLLTIKLNEDMDLPYFGNFKTYTNGDENCCNMAYYIGFLELELRSFRAEARKKGSLESFQQFLDRIYPDKNVIYQIEEVEI